LYMDAAEEELVRRYSETRRRHPLAPAGSPLEGIATERELLVPVRARADVLIDTTGLSPHDSKAEIGHWFATGDGLKLGVTLHSFSYKRGLPRGMDIVMDCRFLQNPHWVAELRKLDGRDAAVADYVAADPRFAAFFDKVKELADLLLPAHRDEGKAHLSIGFGCTGGKHRSVTMTEKLAEALAQDGWHVSKRHRELERRAGEDNKGNAV
ncbi:MAG: RNase adapter RapZ, partial [Pseudomonadota bacterium]